MFNNTADNNPTRLDTAIDRILEKMEALEPDSNEFHVLSEQLSRLYDCRPETKPAPQISPDTLLIIAGNLAGIILILSFEHAHVVTSKALGFVIKTRL